MGGPFMSRPARAWSTQYGEWSDTAWEPAELRPPGREHIQLRLERSRLTWRPSAEIASEAPAELMIEFDVYRDSEGRRRWIPVGGGEAFLSQAWAAGLAILSHHRRFNGFARFSYRTMKLL